jgi:hypothetical protein
MDRFIRGREKFFGNKMAGDAIIILMSKKSLRPSPLKTGLGRRV